MRITFLAKNGAFVDDGNGALSCGLGGTDSAGVAHYMTLQRSSEGNDEEDWGIYLEFDDQINSGYERVLRCHLSRDRFSIDLRAQLGSLVGVDGFDVTLALANDLYDGIRLGLPRIFRGVPEALLVS
jgi:hypothetical protein